MSNRIDTTAGHFLLGLSLSAIGISALAAENDPGISVTTNVDRISVSQTGAIPVIEVSATGNSYDTVANDKFSMHYDAEVSCKGLWDVHYFEVALSGSQSWYTVKGKNFQKKPIGSYTDLLAAWGVDTQDKSRTVHGRTLIGPIVPQLRDAAIDKCKAEAQKYSVLNNISLAKAMATERQFPLPNSNWMKDNLQLQAWTSCGMPQDQITWLSVFDAPPDIAVRCLAKPYAEGVDPQDMPNQLDSQFQLTQLELSANPTEFQGSCPKDLVLTGTLAANKAGSVNYRWKSGNTVSAPAKLTFVKAGSRQVTRTIPVDHSWDQTFTLVTDAPGKSESNGVDVKFSCVTARGPGDKVQAPKPPLPPPPVPQSKSDLLPGGTLTVGNNTAQWGHTLTVNASKSALGMQGNACGLAMNYEVRNVGQGNAGAFTSRLSTGANTLHSDNVQSLSAGATRKISGAFFLPNGDYTVAVFADNQTQVMEANEGNNQATILLKVRNCDHPSQGNGQP